MKMRQKTYHCPICYNGTTLLFIDSSCKGNFNCPYCHGTFYIELEKAKQGLSLRRRKVVKETVIVGVKCSRCGEESKKIFKREERWICDICHFVLNEQNKSNYQGE